MKLKIVSGGQTGVDRAALDAAMASGIPVGGWCPGKRNAYDGKVPMKYPLKEGQFTDLAGYVERTLLNLVDSDGTLALKREPLTEGTGYTIDRCKILKKPCFVVTLNKKFSENKALRAKTKREILRWIKDNKIRRLNVAGPGEEKHSGVYREAYSFLIELFN